MGRASTIAKLMVGAAIGAYLVLANACSSYEASVSPDAGADAASLRPGECNAPADCALPSTTPADCAEAICDTSIHRGYRARDADGDGQRAAACAAVGATVPIDVGTDCDDADATTFAGAPEVCDGKDHTTLFYDGP